LRRPKLSTRKFSRLEEEEEKEKEEEEDYLYVFKWPQYSVTKRNDKTCKKIVNTIS
jgi:hypothetical protein